MLAMAFVDNDGYQEKKVKQSRTSLFAETQYEIARLHR